MMQFADTYRNLTLGITAAIVLLLAIVVSSYRQTIFAYPKGGGSYIVTRDSLGVSFSLIAGAALLIGYVVTVAVSIASGAQNLLSTPLAAALDIADKPVAVGVPAFRHPQPLNAALTLFIMAGILAFLFPGISWLGADLHAVYWEHEGKATKPVIEHLSGAIFGKHGTGLRTGLYYLMQFSTAAVLFLAANTAFAGMVTVVLPEFVSRKGWHSLLHNKNGLLLRYYLLNKPGVIVSNVRYFLDGCDGSANVEAGEAQEEETP